MQTEKKYNAKKVINQAANCNRIPKSFLFKKLLLLSLFVAPFVAWFLWFR